MPTVEAPMVHKAVLLSSIVTAVARRWYRSVAALTHPYSLCTLGRNVTPRKHMDNLCLKPGPHLWTPAKKYRRAIVAPSSRNSIIIDNEGYMFEVDESTGSPKGPGLAASRRCASLTYLSTSTAVPIKANGRARGAIWLGQCTG